MYFKWVGQKNYLDPTVQDNVIEFRTSLREPGYTSHFPIDPKGYVKGEFLRGPEVKDPKDTKPYDFTDDDYRLRHLQTDPRIEEATP